MRLSSNKFPISTPDPLSQPSGFFVARSPLLSFDVLLSWGADLLAPTENDSAKLQMATAHDCVLLRKRLQAILNRPEVLDALFVASPDVHEALEIWRCDPESKKGRRAEAALVRYVIRMASRATPFGLFSGWSVGRMADNTSLVLPGQEGNKRHSRLDNEFLLQLADQLDLDTDHRAALVYRPNTSLCWVGGRHRYAETRLQGQSRSYYLVAVEGSDFLDATLRRAASGTRRQELATALVADDADGEVTLDEAIAFVDSLIDAKMLISDLAPCVTGSEPVHDLIAHLQKFPSGASFAAVLEEARGDLARIDVSPPGTAADDYRAVATKLKIIRPDVEIRHLFQVDLSKDAGSLTLDTRVTDEVLRGVEALRRITAPHESDGLKRFRTGFVERYGDGCEVALAEALDEEVGVGYQAKSELADGAPLLAGLPFQSAGSGRNGSWGRREEVMLQKLETSIASGAIEIVLEGSDIERMAAPKADPLPAAFAVFCALAASPEAAADAFQILLRTTSGPSGARFFGRFCQADGDLRAAVEEHMRVEEAHSPDAVFAEVVHLPQGRIGNVLNRPVLRDYEIPFLGRSGAPAERQIPIRDLRVSVVGTRIVLRSELLGREVVPRLTSMHAFSNRALGIYQFLCELQGQGTAEHLGWRWGELEAASFLPRVRYGRVVLTRARWKVGRSELALLNRETVDERFMAVQKWRTARSLPRYVVLIDGDNELLLDLDNVLIVESFLDLVRKRSQLVLTELFPTPDQMCARGPEGRFVHELVIPFVRPSIAPLRDQGVPKAPSAVKPPTPPQRSFTPGSEWLYAKLYTGHATADRVLREAIAPLIRDTHIGDGLDGWFFIRYSDPGFHVRIRLHGNPSRLSEDVLPRLHACLEPLFKGKSIWRIQVDTYEREIERYGGPEGILQSERLFCHDSHAVLSIIENAPGDEATDTRWRLALVGTDLLFKDFGLDLPRRLSLAERLRDMQGERFIGGGLKRALGDRFRKYRKELEPLLLAEAPPEPLALAQGLAALNARSERLAPVIAALREGHKKGRIARSPEELLSSFTHMHVNRMMRAAPNEHEFVIYDFLARIYESRIARDRSVVAGQR